MKINSKAQGENVMAEREIYVFLSFIWGLYSTMYWTNIFEC